MDDYFPNLTRLHPWERFVLNVNAAVISSIARFFWWITRT